MSYLVAFNLDNMKIGLVKLNIRRIEKVKFYNGTFAYVYLCNIMIHKQYKIVLYIY